MKSKVSLLWTYLHLQLIQHVEACRTANLDRNFLLKSFTVDWHNCKNTCYYSKSSCSTNFSEVYPERHKLTAHPFGLSHLDCSCCYFKIHHKTSCRQNSYIIKSVAIKQTYKCQTHWKEAQSWGKNHLKTFYIQIIPKKLYLLWMETSMMFNIYLVLII